MALRTTRTSGGARACRRKHGRAARLPGRVGPWRAFYLTGAMESARGSRRGARSPTRRTWTASGPDRRDGPAGGWCVIDGPRADERVLELDVVFTDVISRSRSPSRTGRSATRARGLDAAGHGVGAAARLPGRCGRRHERGRRARGRRPRDRSRRRGARRAARSARVAARAASLIVTPPTGLGPANRAKFGPICNRSCA